MASDFNLVHDLNEIIIEIHSDGEDENENVPFQFHLFNIEGDFEHGIHPDAAAAEQHGQQHNLDLNVPANEDVEQGVELYGFDLNFPHPSNVNENHNHLKRRLGNYERFKILLWLLDKQNNGKLPKGSITRASEHFEVSRQTISKLWNTAQEQKRQSQDYNVDNKKKNCGRKRIELPRDEMVQLGMGERTCIRDLAAMLSLSSTTVWRMIKRGLIKPHTNSLHPWLREANKIARLKWIFSLLIGDSPHTKSTYYPMYNFVHLDEKWFNLTRKSQRYYIEANEIPDYRAAISSTDITKVMFTAVVARPRFNDAGECIFDGKIGIFPFTYEEPAKRSSKNRQRGTMVTKTIKSINRNVTRHMLIHQILPAIREKWPQEEGVKTIYIQQDNARAHINQDDPEWQLHCNQGDFNFVLLQQPPNSPDLNILDLGFFTSIQKLAHKKMPKNPDELLKAVVEAFEQLDAKTLRNVWYTLQFVMNKILGAKGGNDYELPHNYKERLERQGLLPEMVNANRWVVEDCWNLVEEFENRASSSTV